ncbi:ras-related protein Rab-22A-like [Dendronephthya gigantea]|uniref:ras-related protein Rab-22A-like n=1 Tax=Dendronephthya gigantea TaxID=151771 RepID=UPI00106D8E04|nr:ras-related protein Rab-22A-like [Dendronephthya gigantea]
MTNVRSSSISHRGGDSMREIKVCLLGDTGVGKSCLVLRFVSDRFEDRSKPTIGASFMSKMFVADEQVYKFQIWDTAGQERYRSLAPLYYRDASAAIVVYDITNQSSFFALKDWIKEIKRYGPNECVVAIAGNKCDLEDQREIATESAREYAESVEAIFAETSALSARNVQELFIEISRRLPQPNYEKVSTLPTLTEQNTERQKSCC